MVQLINLKILQIFKIDDAAFEKSNKTKAAKGTENGAKSQHTNDAFNTIYANMKLFPTSIATVILGGVKDQFNFFHVLDFSSKIIHILIFT